MEHLLNKLNVTMEKVVDKLDEQGHKISELSVKIDLYREAQNEHARKLDEVDKVSTEALTSTKSAHKRLDEVPSKDQHNNHSERIGKLEKVVYWVGTLVIGSVILSVLGVVLIKN